MGFVLLQCLPLLLLNSVHSVRLSATQPHLKSVPQAQDFQFKVNMELDSLLTLCVITKSVRLQARKLEIYSG